MESFTVYIVERIYLHNLELALLLLSMHITFCYNLPSYILRINLLDYSFNNIEIVRSQKE